MKMYILTVYALIRKEKTMSDLQSVPRIRFQQLKSLTTKALWIVIPLLVGLLVAWQIPRPVVGVLTIDMPILPFTTTMYLKQLEYIREHPEIRAVVIAINCPGGTVVGTEAIYQEIMHVRETKPVIVTIEDMAASGGYYIAMAGDYVYANPTSDVGNIGVISVLPPNPLVVEDTIWTGPYKAFGSSPDTSMRQAEMIKNQFYAVVERGRGDALKAKPESVKSGALWSGTTALQLGLIDSFGVRSDALQHAAREAKISHYETLDLSQVVTMPEFSFFFGQLWQGQHAYHPTKPGVYLWYLPQEERITR
jgi:protease IV